MSKSTDNPILDTLKQMIINVSWGMHMKLIVLFVVIKVLPLILIALIAWEQSSKMAEELGDRMSILAQRLDDSLVETGTVAVDDSMDALEIRVRNEFERLTTDLASRVASMLYAVDDDLRFLASVKPSKETYKAFLEAKQAPILVPSEWVLSPNGKEWVLATPLPTPEKGISRNPENTGFHYRPSDPFKYADAPLYFEISYISLKGQELVKVTTGDRTDPKLKDVSKKENTFVKAETYFQEAQKLKSGEIWVSDVTGAYVSAPFIGAYTPTNTASRNLEFTPEEVSYAGTENPNGKRFEGIIRWIMPVEENGKRVGYVSLAYNHDHIIDVTNRTMPTDGRYAELGDPIKGNYAFIWDHLGKNIVHPRHHSIVGFDPETGDQAIPWLEQSIYDDYIASGKPYAEFIQDVPIFDNQSRSKKPAAELTQQGLLGLDCRYLNNAPQCIGWFDLAERGGSGSVHILWTGLTKITTAAAIPYYTGPYGKSKIGFGFVALSAGFEDFQAPALDTQEKLNELIKDADYELELLASESQNFIIESLVDIATSLTVSTILMTILVVIIAIMLASALTRMVTQLVNGFSRFRNGERQFRFFSTRTDELGTLADSFDELADNLVSSVHEPQFILDADKTIIFMNEQAEEWCNKDLSDVVGQSFYSIAEYDEDSPYDPIAAYNTDRTAEIMYNAERDAYFQDKAIRMSVSDYEEDEEGYIITTTDMTEIIRNEQHIEAQRQLLDTIFNESPDMMWLKNVKAQQYQMVNPRFATISGKHSSEYLGKTAIDMHGPRMGQESDSFDLEVINKGRTLLREQTVNFYDGHVETLEVLRTPMFNAEGEIVSILGIGRDVTQRVEAQRNLLQIQHQLEDALRESNAANAAKSDFLARMSHEIRTPMNAIIGLTDIVHRSLQNPNADLPKILSQIENIEKSSKHLLSLLNDILDLSKIEAGKVEIELTEVDLNATIQGVDVIIRPRCEEKQINYNINFDDKIKYNVISDALRLRQVLINLLGNAVKFTPENGNVDLNIIQVAQEETRIQVRFEVKDSGIGISEDGIAKLFKPFEQAESNTSRLYGGTGLGLSISNSIINYLGGNINIESTVNQGSTFHFTLWFDTVACKYDALAASKDIEIVTSAPIDLSKKRILLADDVELNRLIVLEMLKDLHMQIDEVADGTEAVEMFNNSAEGYYDLILMDALMPQLTGYEAATAIRQLNRSDAKDIPIIAVTANAFKEDVERALASGMNAHIAKPIEFDKLLSLVKEYTTKRISS